VDNRAAHPGGGRLRGRNPAGVDSRSTPVDNAARCPPASAVPRLPTAQHHSERNPHPPLASESFARWPESRRQFGRCRPGRRSGAGARRGPWGHRGRCLPPLGACFGEGEPARGRAKPAPAQPLVD